MLLILALATASAATIEIAPGGDWCGAINAALPGDEVHLQPGDHAGPCALRASGEPGSPVVLASSDPTDPARIVYEGASSNVIDVLASHVVLRGLSLGPSEPDIDAVKIKSGSSDVRIEGCTFAWVGGISIAANSASGDGLAIVGNTFTSLRATGVYVGCHGGAASCVQGDVLVAENTFDGVTSSAVGYAIEIKLDSWGVVRDNTIRATQGPGIEIYGSSDASVTSTVERNLVWGSLTSASIEIGGGPAIVRNNIVIGGIAGGISAYDYGGRGLQHGVRILGNTVMGNGGPAIAVSGWSAGRDLEVRDNAAWQAVGAGPALPPPIDGVPMDGNVDCVDPVACWVDASELDFWPAAGSPLLTSGATVEVEGTLETDLCGVQRGDVPHAGAFERTGAAGPGRLGFVPVPELRCPAPEDTDGPDDSDAPAADDTDPVGETDSGDPEGCGCGSGGPGLLGAGVGLLLVALRRRKAGS